MISHTKPAAERRADLLDAGLELFAERGFAKATIAEIVERAGVAQGTFYLHFATKEALLSALQDRFEERMVARAAAAIAASGADWGQGSTPSSSPASRATRANSSTTCSSLTSRAMGCATARGNLEDGASLA